MGFLFFKTLLDCSADVPCVLGAKRKQRIRRTYPCQGNSPYFAIHKVGQSVWSPSKGEPEFAVILQDWVLDLPDTHSLLDVNTGVRYPKEQLFQSRQPNRLPPMLREYPDLHFGQSQGASAALPSMLPAMQPQGKPLSEHIIG